MKKKILLFFTALTIGMFGLFNSSNSLTANAQDDYLFSNNFIPLEYYDYGIVVEHVTVYEYIVIYWLPFMLPDSIIDSMTMDDYFFLYSLATSFLKGYSSYTSRGYYRLENIVKGETETYFYYRFTMGKSLVDSNYPDGIEEFFAEDSNMIIRYSHHLIEPERVMKNFLLAEPNLNNGYEQMIGNEKYYMYLDARVYLPDGTYIGLSALPDVLSDRSELFGDFVVVAFNLSPRARFWSSALLTDDYIAGLSYIVYDIVVNTTTIYDYMGRVVYQENAIVYIDTPQFLIPEMEALDYQLKASYEEGKNEGYRQGREEGIRAGKRQMQEEMQKVIDELVERYEKEIEKAYNRGKLEGANEEFDIFGYLQALFGEQGLGRLLKLELLPGVSLGAVIMIPLAFWLVSFIMRWFR